MFVDFDAIFKPTTKQKINSLEFLKEKLRNSLNTCRTCEYFKIEEVYAIGGVLDYVSTCTNDMVSVREEAENIYGKRCSYYIESKKNIEEINNTIKKLYSYIEELKNEQHRF